MGMHLVQDPTLTSIPQLHEGLEKEKGHSNIVTFFTK